MTRMLVPWDVESPRLFEDFQREMNQLMSNFFGREDGGRQLAWFAPRTNVAETDKSYDVTVDLPGMKPEEFTIELKEGQLWITGERKREEEEKGKTYHRIERQYGQFRRIIPLDVPVDADKVEAEYKEGVLHVTVPKSKTVKPKRIEVKA
jgi:HSP20 family protein